MLALVIVSTFVVLLLGILVAGLLRSHADILRSLHELGVGVGDPTESAAATRPRPGHPGAAGCRPRAGRRSRRGRRDADRGRPGGGGGQQ